MRNITLTQINLVLIPIIAAIVISATGFVVAAVMDNRSAHDAMSAKIELSNSAIVANFDAKLALQPSQEWRDRITKLEVLVNQQALTSARLELMVSDIRTRLFSEPKTASK